MVLPIPPPKGIPDELFVPGAGGPVGAAGVTPPGFSTPNPNFAGISNINGVAPADTVGAVGPNHFIQMVNISFQIWDKQGNSLAGPFNINSLWSTFGGACQTRNDGDPYILYDHLADRWVLSQFAIPNGFAPPPTHQCVAVSRTADPVAGGWFLYDFTFTFGHDYPKLGLWPDGYYLSSQQGFSGGSLNAVVLDRANMLNGNPATFQAFTLGPPALIILPSSLDGPPPPAGSPAFFARHVDGGLWGGADRVEVYALHVDWGVPANSTFTLNASLPVAAFSSDLCSGTNLFDNCVPQPGDGTLETLPHWAMGRLQYRTFGTHESMVFNHTVDVDGADHAGIRWYELRRTPPGAGAWSVFQQATHSPDAGNPGLADDPHRWMGSIAMDKAGNMALGYSVSSSTVFPGIAYVGRLATDPLGEMPQGQPPNGEFTLIAGQGFMTFGRWGDYSSMTVDPVDGCTFWYTTMWGGPGNDNDWRTQIGAFRFATCNPADLAITKVGTPNPVIAGEILTYQITVTNNGPDTATNVQVVDVLPAGTTFLTSSVPCPSTAPPAGERTCSLGTLAAGDSRTIQIQVRVNSNLVVATGGSSTLTNTATVTADQLDPDTGNNTASAETLVNDSADLRLTKDCKPDAPLQAGGTATCTILVDNLGPSDARSVVVTDTHVSNGAFTITSATFSPPAMSPCAVAGGVVTCNLGTEPAGGRTTIIVQLTSTGQVDVDDTATVTSATPDPNLSNNSAQDGVRFIGVADLALTKTDAPDPVVAGTNLTYTLNVTNSGPSAAPNVVVKDTLPGQVSDVTFTPSVGSCIGGIPGNPLQPLTCNLGSLASGASASITIMAKVNASTPNGTILVNNAVVSSDFADPNNGNNNATALTTVQARADLVIVKTSDAPTYKPSSLITYTVTVTNLGPSDAQAVVVTDNLPDIKQAVYLSDTGGCTKSGNTLTCALGNMPIGTSKSFNIDITVKGNRGDVSNTASVGSSTVDPTLANNTSTLVVTVQGGG
ncbi:MAG: hypothetical protein AUH81_01450 [Candidatus Rokubacteria bacterium 13_1_40CM_4_69_5]|nr:MAG: hypothetical protein AUH81_01450 [Candidatus Rokubacteria bacterium 13_1_40CM_4_69_5]